MRFLSITGSFAVCSSGLCTATLVFLSENNYILSWP